ncbi:high-affinity iron permease [Tulasnella sp. 424]|nr:high-affinity iron permease [Tulasnella sp. 424]KAG8962846.1 high-affinity iron permease [Tulasnella sp. 425]
MIAVFSVPIFFIVFREALEASIIVSVLLALQPGSGNTTAVARERTTDSDEKKREGSHTSESEDLALGSQAETNVLIKKMRILVFAGSVLGLFVALAIAIQIFVMGLTMLRIDKAKAKWRAKLHKAFITDVANTAAQGLTSKWAKWSPFRGGPSLSGEDKWEMSSGKWALFLSPFITVMREGLEAVVFIGGPSSVFCGLIRVVGYIIYRSSSRTSISIFLVISTNLMLLVGASLFSKAIGSFQRNKFNKMVGADVAEAGNGPGSYDIRGNIWHLNCCNPEDKYGNGGWAIFAAIFGWSNDGSVGTVLGYIFYWIAVVVALVVMQNHEEKNRRRASAQTA